MLLLLGSACKKPDGVNQNLNPDNQRPVDFMSTKSGSYWRYGARDGKSYTRYAREKDTMKNNLKYSYYESQDDSSGALTPEYFGKNGVYHITLFDLDGAQTSYLEYAFWKDSARKGDTWTNTGQVFYQLVGNVEVVIESTQSEDGLTMTVGSNTFSNVVYVLIDAKATLLNLKVATFDIWFVKGIGVIREEANVDIASGAFTQNHIDSLLSYHIEQ